jgi:hypothetical protein
MARNTYRLRNGELVEKKTGEVLQTSGKVCAPMVMRDIPEYESPIDGRMISSRSQKREDLKRNNCIEVDPSVTLTKVETLKERWAGLITCGITVWARFTIAPQDLGLLLKATGLKASDRGS